MRRFQKPLADMVICGSYPNLVGELYRSESAINVRTSVSQTSPDGVATHDAELDSPPKYPLCLTVGFREVELAVTSWSIQREDILLLRALRGIHHSEGFYIDVGANAPDEHSVTKLFYDHGWHGINVEPSPYWHQRLCAERPRDINIHAAASDKSGILTLFDHPEGGLGTIREEFADRHEETLNLAKRCVQVNALTLTHLCEQYAPSEIHFLKIDVEGHEEQAIRGMDFKRFRPWIVCVEATEPLRVDVLTHEDWDFLITGADYRYMMFDGLNRWYVAEERPERFGAFEYPADDFIHYSYLRRIEGLEKQVWQLESRSLEPDRQQSMPRQLAEAVAFRGDDANHLYRAMAGTEEPTTPYPTPVGFQSSICHQHHFLLDQYRFWAKALKDRPKFYRKQWEFVYIAQTLWERGMLAPGKRGLGFGVGREPLPSLFASFGSEIVATDQSLESAINGGWVSTHQHTIDLSGLNDRGICTSRMLEDLVSFQAVDMNHIGMELSGQFDFCWSACAFEHLGSLKHGLDFVENSLRTLKPGGVAIHTTEYNLSSNDDTVETQDLSIYRRCDIEPFIEKLRARGFEVSPIDWKLGEGFAEQVVDLPPFGRGEPHIRLKAGQYDVTSIGLIIGKPN